MILAIVGSSALSGPGSRRIVESVIGRYTPAAIVSGGARGIDSLAAQVARERGLFVIEHKPEVQRWADAPRLADGTVLRGFKSRNLEIAKGCDALVRIAWNPEEQARVTGRPASYGSGWTRDRAQGMGKPTDEYVLTLAQDADEKLDVESAFAIGSRPVDLRLR